MMKKIFSVLLFCATVVFVSCSKDDPGVVFVPGLYSLPEATQQWVRKYPGEVTADVPRLGAIQVVVRGDYQPSDPKMAVKSRYWQSTGLYAAPAEEIVVNVPAGVLGLKYQIGAADVELAAGTSVNRFEKVTKNGSLAVGVNRISGDFGGPLYFYFENEPKAVTLTVSGAVRSMDYIAGTSDKAAWLAAVADPGNKMIWGELIGERVILTLPREILRKVKDPELLLNVYDDIIELDFNAVFNVKNADLQLPHRIYYDVQLPGDAAMHAAYPMPFVSSASADLAAAIVGMSDLADPNCQVILKGIAEMMNMVWTGSGLLEQSVLQSVVYHTYQRQNKWGNLALTATQAKDPSARYWMARETDTRTMVLQLLQQYGWGLYGYTSIRSREEIPTEVISRYKTDLFAIYACEYGNVNLTDFFAAWGLPLSSFVQQYMLHYPKPSSKFWESTDLSKQPANSSTTPAGVSYEKIIPTQDYIYDRSHWSVSASSEGTYLSDNMVDGDYATYWQSAIAGKNYPHFVQAEFKDASGNPVEEEFNYLYFVQPEYTDPGTKSFSVIIQAVPNDPDAWVEVEDGKIFYLTRDNQHGKDNVQFVCLSQAYKAYGVKIMLNSGLPKTEGGTDAVNHTGLAEFGTALLN